VPVLLIGSDPAFADHDTGPGHPERAARLDLAIIEATKILRGADI
jgi:hypothetical protein